MPRLIDHAARATEIIEAAWRVLVREGAAAVSVRSVAAEAGLATGSLRRSFPTQAALLAGCLNLMGERVAIRIAALPTLADPVSQGLAQLGETLPLDPTRRVELEVYLALGTAALSDPGLREPYAQIDDGLARLCSHVLGQLRPDAEEIHARQVQHLHALVDGLAAHILHGLAPGDAVAVLRAHLHLVASASPPLP